MRALGQPTQGGVDDLVAIASSTDERVRVGSCAPAAGIAGRLAPRVRRNGFERCEPAKRVGALVAAVCEMLQCTYTRLGESGSRLASAHRGVGDRWEPPGHRHDLPRSCVHFRTSGQVEKSARLPARAACRRLLRPVSSRRAQPSVEPLSVRSGCMAFGIAWVERARVERAADVAPQRCEEIAPTGAEQSSGGGDPLALHPFEQFKPLRRFRRSWRLQRRDQRRGVEPLSIVSGGVKPRISGEQRASEATRCRAEHQEVASRQAASRLLRCAPALRVTCHNLLIRLAFMAGSQLPAVTDPFARTHRSRMSTPTSCVRQISALLRSHQHPWSRSIQASRWRAPRASLA